MKYRKWIDRLPNLKDKIYVITGANSGIGFEAARYLAYKEATIIMACRSEARAKSAKEKIINENHKAKIDIIKYDQSDLASIDNFIDELKDRYQTINGIILNAGIFFVDKNLTTKQNIPLTIGTNYIGVYYLLRKLISHYRHDKHAIRFVFVSSIVSNGHQRLTLKQSLKANLSMYRQYTNSKIGLNKLFHVLANGVNLYDFPERGKHIFCLTHPGISGTDIIKNFPSWFKFPAQQFMNTVFQNPEKASLPMIHAAIAPFVFNGSYFAPRGLFQFTGLPKTVKLPARIDVGSGQLIYDTGKFIDNIITKQKNIIE